jgi:hypothetical protein
VPRGPHSSSKRDRESPIPEAPRNHGTRWPPGYGRFEWFNGRHLAVYSTRPRLFEKIWAVPGVRRHQTGDQEIRAVFPPEALEQVATVIRASGGVGVAGGAPRISSQTPDKRVLRGPRIASRRPAWPWA